VAFIKRSASKNSLMPVAGCRSVDCLKRLIHLTVSLVETGGRQWTAVEEDFVLLEVAKGGATGSGPSESSYSNYGISCGVEGSGSSERGDSGAQRVG
jgi:hypothetical protein